MIGPDGRLSDTAACTDDRLPMRERAQPNRAAAPPQYDGRVATATTGRALHLCRKASHYLIEPSISEDRWWMCSCGSAAIGLRPTGLSASLPNHRM